MASAVSGSTLKQIHKLFGEGTVAGLSDGQLLERFAVARDEAAFAALVARHGPMVLGVCRAVLRNEHDAEDAFQATFLTLARKAGALRVRGTLGGWLYRVSSRVAVHAHAGAERRRRHEHGAMLLAAARQEGEGASPWRDWLPVLHEEIGRLPERQRAPIVLCGLQGLTYEEAARELRWTVPTLRCRLAKARERLRGRLSRRGMGLPGAGAALAALLDARPASATVPDAWARAAVQAATGNATASITVTSLTARMLKVLSLARLREAVTIALALGAVVSIGVVATDRWRSDPAGPAMVPPTDPPKLAPASAPAPAAAPAANSPEDEDDPGGTVEVRGRVVDPDGKPVAGATVRVDHYLWLTVKPADGGPKAISGADGGYTLVAPRDVMERFARGEDRFPLHLVASAPGYGPGWAEVTNTSGVLNDVTVRLAADDLPIEGRILDLEGRPVAGAEIVTTNLFDPPGGDLTPWIEGMKAHPGGPHDGSLQDIPFAVRTTTGPDGRFRLDGVGRERVVMFTVSGPTVAVTRTFVMTKDVPPLRSSNTHIIGPKTMIFHGARFDFAVAPSKPVVGTVRDLDTGAPLAGVRVNGMAYDERSSAFYHEVESTTDNQGHYRLTGMAKGEKYQLFLFPGKGLPYYNATFVETAATPGLEPATIDLKLKRGVLVRGRITDERTGKPVKGGSVDSFAMKDNPHVDEYPGFRHSVYATTAYPDEDGRFEIAALPGRGMLGVRAGSDRYPRGVGAEAFQEKDSRTSLPAYPGFPFAGNYNLVVAFDAGAGSEPVSLDLQLDPGRTLTVTAVDPEGKPVPGCRAFGTRPTTYWDRRPLDSGTFEVTGLDPKRTRLVMVFHEGRRLGGSILVTEDDDGPLTVRLQPCGVVKGRLIDEEGQPRTGLEVISTRVPDTEADQGVFDRKIQVDHEGRFRIDVIPGLSYSARALSDGSRSVGQVFTKLTFAPGEVKDVGDVVLKMPRPD